MGMHEASVQLFEEYRQKYDGSVDRALAETIQAIALQHRRGSTTINYFNFRINFLFDVC